MRAENRSSKIQEQSTAMEFFSAVYIWSCACVWLLIFVPVFDANVIRLLFGRTAVTKDHNDIPQFRFRQNPPKPFYFVSLSFCAFSHFALEHSEHLCAKFKFAEKRKNETEATKKCNANILVLWHNVFLCAYVHVFRHPCSRSHIRNRNGFAFWTIKRIVCVPWQTADNAHMCRNLNIWRKNRILFELRASVHANNLNIWCFRYPKKPTISCSGTHTLSCRSVERFGLMLASCRLWRMCANNKFNFIDRNFWIVANHNERARVSDLFFIHLARKPFIQPLIFSHTAFISMCDS